MIIWKSCWKRSPLLYFQLSTRRLASKATYIAPRMRIADLLETVPSHDAATEFAVAGFIRSIRKQKQIAFASVGDGSTIKSLQAILTPEQAKQINNGSAVVIQGQWTRSLADKEQPYELIAAQVQIQGDNDAPSYPIQRKYHTADFLRTLPHLRVRTAHNALLLRLRSQIIADTTNFFAKRHYIQAHPPVITSSDCEGAGEVFTVGVNCSEERSNAGKETPGYESFFGSQKYLTVSTQLHLEALSQSVGKVWALSPTFRAERSDTSRHLSEFYMLEAEIAFATGIGEVMDIVEELVHHLASSLKQSDVGKELLQVQKLTLEAKDTKSPKRPIDLFKRWNSLTKRPWPRVTYHEVCSQLKQAVSDQQVAFENPPDGAGGLQTEHEKFIADELFGCPTFVTDYPRALKPFYMAPSPKATKDEDVISTVSCFDLLLPEICEVAGGSMREHRLGPLEEAMRQQGLLGMDGMTQVEHDVERTPATGSHSNKANSNLDWYLDLRRYGSVPHGGFGLGFDRLLGFLAGVDSIRDIVTFPRHFKRCIA